MECLHPQMKMISKLVKDVLTQTIHTAFNISQEATVFPVINKIQQDYQSPSAVQLFNTCKASHNSFGFTNAKDLASHIKEKLVPNEVVDSLEISEEGFIFVRVKDNLIETGINNLLNHGIHIEEDRRLTIAVDFSHPNIAKEMHVGHLRSTILGESLCRILEAQGHNVHRINHLGDWGTQFGMLINHLKEAYPDYQNNLPSLSDLTTFYKEAKKKFDTDADFKKKAQLTVVDLQRGDPECRKAWQALCDISRQEFNKIYQRLNIKLYDCGESYYNSMLPDIIKDLEEKGHITISHGAKCMFLEGKKIPLMVQKSDGGFNYDSTDVAAAKYRLLDLKADRLIYVTDMGQQDHFALVFAAAEKLNWHQPPKTRMDHMGFGLVTNQDGQKFKTRSGDTIKLIDLLDEAKKRAADQITMRMKEHQEGCQTFIQKDEIDQAAERIGMAAVKYFDLKQKRISNYKFNYDQMLDPKGNTAVYLMYSYARICSILNKSGITQDDMKNTLSKGGFKITHPHERYIAISLLRFPEVIQTVTDELNIHKLCDFIYDIAIKIAEGYNKYRIIDDPNKDTRILLCEAIRRMLSTAFYMVGINPLEKI
jgi:arginyl-tRNA synthetase